MTEATVITEEWLQHQAIEATVQRLAQTACEALFGPNRVSVSQVRRIEDDKWEGRCDVHAGGFASWATWDVSFAGQSYIDGAVKVDHCSVPQPSAAVTTGKYDLLDNRDSSVPVDRKVTVSDSDTTEVQNTLAESVELSNKFTVGGGSPLGGDVSDEFTSTFGIAKTAMQDSSSSHSDSDEITQTVPGYDAIGIVHTEQDSLTECVTQIGSAIDWTAIHFHIGTLDDPRVAFGHNMRHDLYPNWVALSGQPRAVRESGGRHEYCNIQCSSLDDWVSWMQGRNPRQTARLRFTTQADRDLDWLAGRNNRVDFAGKQVHASKVGSWVAHEIPREVSKADAEARMSTAGKDAATLFA